MFHSSSARRLAVFPAVAAFAALATLSAAVALAQPASAQPEAAPTSVPPAPVLTYRSAFEGYRPFADEKAIPWKEANETVYRRGGWQAYAKEASGTGSAESESPKGAAAAPAAQPGHSMPMPAKKEKP